MNLIPLDSFEIDEAITSVIGFALSSPYGDGNNLGQPSGLKSVGFIEVQSESGKVGIGECYAGVYSPSLMQGLGEFFNEYLAGSNLNSKTLLTELNDVPFIGRNGLLKSGYSALEMALWDLTGHILDTPVHQLWNASGKQTIPLYYSGGSAAMNQDAIERDVTQAMEGGFTAYKLRVGFQEWQEDLRRLERARKVLEGRPLMVDAIMGTLRPTWDIVKAQQRIQEMVKFQISWVEEPLHPQETQQLAKLKSFSPIPIAAGEAYSGPFEFNRILDTAAVDILQFDATHSGGMGFTMDLIHKASEIGMKTVAHVWGSPLSLVANSSLAAASNRCNLVEYPSVRLALADDIWIHRASVSRGEITLGGAPGFGVRISSHIKETFAYKANSGFKLPKPGPK